MSKEANLRDFVFHSARKTAELAPAKQKERETQPNMPTTGDFANTPFKGGQAFEREEPPKDHMRRYWRQYETTPIIQNPIDAFASQVVEPGYWIESEHLSDDEIKELEKWLRKAAILEKVPENDVLHMFRKAIVQREVRGTALIQKVYAKEDEEKLYGVAFLNAETVRPNTQPGTPLLLMPDDKPGDFEDAEGELPKTEDGRTAAYTQYTTKSGFNAKDPSSEDVNNFAIDDVIKLTRDADVNEAFGTSRLEACSDVIEGLKQKMLDQNEAIASKAYPLWLFMFGSEERPWDRDDISRFMNAHEMENFHPGLKQGVRGDVSIETISGEVAEVVDYLEFDINYIMSAMPMPKYILGGFESNINQFVSRTQERSVNRQIKDARRELEAEFGEVIQQKAVELFSMNDEEAEEVFLKIGRPDEEMIDENPQINTINYQGKNTGADPNSTNQHGAGGDGSGRNGVPDDPGSPSGSSGSGSGGGSDSPEENSVWDVDLPAVEELANTGAELQETRALPLQDVENDLSNAVETVFLRYQQEVITRLRREYADAPYAASMSFEDMANTALNTATSAEDFSPATEVIMLEALRRVYDRLPGMIDGSTRQYTFGLRERRNAKAHAQSVQQATREALQGLVMRMNRQLEVGANNGEELAAIIERIENTYSREALSARARLISRMELQHAVEATKLEEFEIDPAVAGVKVVNPCGPDTTRLCKDLSGCGPRNGAVARFDSEQSLSEQWTEQAGAYTYSGFTPLPPAPPFHFNCRSELIPVGEAELEAALAEAPVTSVSALEAKYDISVDE